MSQDIILITIDALRHDSVSRLEYTSEYFSEEQSGEAITSGAATNWVFPGILSGTYYPEAYDENGLLRNELVSLPEKLDGEGYDTAAFLGFNPYLSKWSERFETFWNGGVDDANEEWYNNGIEKWVSRAYRTALLKKRVSGEKVVKEAQDWYENGSGPQFLWIHLMEPHGPYYPGFSAGLDIGLVDTYRSVLNFQRMGDDAPQRDIDVQRALYERCVERADQRVKDILSFVNEDARIVVVGDHGEEFEHGHIDHERLYDECVKVPYFQRNMEHTPQPESVRQIDIPAEILSTVDIDTPEDWNAKGFDTDDPAFMLTPWGENGTFQYAIRTDSEKLIRTYDIDSGEVVEHEYYDLETDPGEKNNTYRSATIDELQRKLNGFIKKYEHALGINPETGIDSELVEERLRNLGYK